MTITFMQTSRLLSRDLNREARNCVREHGAKGAGDAFGAQYIEACEAKYVQQCVERELTAHPDNRLAQQLRAHFQNALDYTVLYALPRY